MIKKVISFLDKHRLILVLLILFIFSFLFLSINSLIFLNHKFTPLECTSELDKNYCFHNNTQILKNPNKAKTNIFKERKKEIKELQKKYKLPEFNYYTSYYYEVASLMHFTETGEDEDLAVFFKNYNRSYDIVNFYKKNIFYFDLFYHYKVV